jgi:hypothetical protein
VLRKTKRKKKRKITTSIFSQGVWSTASYLSWYRFYHKLLTAIIAKKVYMHVSILYSNSCCCVCFLKVPNMSHDLSHRLVFEKLLNYIGRLQESYHHLQLKDIGDSQQVSLMWWNSYHQIIPTILLVYKSFANWHYSSISHKTIELICQILLS